MILELDERGTPALESRLGLDLLVMGLLDIFRRRRTAARMPIAILSFNRPDYLTAVLRSLRCQISHTDRVILFQDGAWNPYSKQLKADPSLISACIKSFEHLIPWGTVAAADHNLGIAENYERAEQEIFGKLQSPTGLFLEDDLVLSPNFLDVTEMLLDLAQNDSRIAYVSAYGHLWASHFEQVGRKHELIHMHENWGFAMTRDAWLAERPFRNEYLRRVRGSDYAVHRDHAAIERFYRERGWNMKVTSQDGARWIATLELGKVRLTTFSCHARYIGRRGAHSTDASYVRSGFDSTTLFTGKPEQPAPPTDAQFEQWLAAERSRFTVAPAAFYAGHLTGEWPLEATVRRAGARP